MKLWTVNILHFFSCMKTGIQKRKDKSISYKKKCSFYIWYSTRTSKLKGKNFLYFLSSLDNKRCVLSKVRIIWCKRKHVAVFFTLGIKATTYYSYMNHSDSFMLLMLLFLSVEVLLKINLFKTSPTHSEI